MPTVARKESMQRPNILYIHSHDTGRHIQPYGADVATPNLQRLAEEGVLFRQAFNVAPTCSPSRAGLVTGMCAHSAGMIGLAHRGFQLKDYHQHLVNVLRPQGYRSTLIGVQHVAPDSEMIGYDQVLPLASNRAEDVTPAAVDWLLHEAPHEPFFLAVGFFETHREYPSAPDASSRYVKVPAPVPDLAVTRGDVADLHASIHILDDAVGQVLTALETSGRADNTLVICTTDHGIAFPGHKCNLTDRGMGVMLMMRGPGEFAGGHVIDGMVSHIDIMPTLCDIIECPTPEWAQGRSIMPLVRGESAEIHDMVFSEVSYHAAYEPIRCVRTPRFKLIRRFGERRTPVLPNCDDSPSKTIWLESGWANRALPDEELYDLWFDPQETRNLANDPTCASVLEGLGARLERWMHDTDDPLLRGHVPAPSGARINPQDGVSPRETSLIVE